MRKLFLTAFCAVIAFCYTATAQTNLQIFYDFGDDRQNVTTTLEGYYSDKWGDTFFFIDYDFNTKKNGVPGSYGSYFEIARGLNFWQNSAVKDLSAHVENSVSKRPDSLTELRSWVASQPDNHRYRGTCPPACVSAT